MEKLGNYTKFGVIYMIQRWRRRGKYQHINYSFIWEFRFVKFHGHFIQWRKLYKFAKNEVSNELIKDTFLDRRNSIS